MHVYRPLIIILGVVVVYLVVRPLVVPPDFGIGKNGYTYAWHRKGAENDAKSVKVKYKGAQYCSACHAEVHAYWSTHIHGTIKCENCHGPAIDHPVDPPKLTIDRSRELCLRCHAYLPYAESGRALIKGIDPAAHNPKFHCSLCHNPHGPK